METKIPKIGVDILIIRENKILLGLLTKKWSVNGVQVYGLPGRDLLFNERMGDCIKRNIKEEFECTVTSYKIIGVNANYEWGNHYINIGATAEIEGDIKLIKHDDWEKWEWLDIHSLPSNTLESAKNTIESYITKTFTVSE